MAVKLSKKARYMSVKFLPQKTNALSRNHLSGECYGFQLYKDGEEMDSCWGFLGDFEEVRKDISEYLPEECWSLMDHLMEASDMRRMELEDYEELLEEMEVGIPRTTLRSRKDKILEKLKELL